MPVVLIWYLYILTVRSWSKSRHLLGMPRNSIKDLYWAYITPIGITFGNWIPAFAFTNPSWISQSEGLTFIYSHTLKGPSSPCLHLPFSFPSHPSYPDALTCSPEAWYPFLRDRSFLLQDLLPGHLFPHCAFLSSGSLLVCCHPQGSFPPHVDRSPGWCALFALLALSTIIYTWEHWLTSLEFKSEGYICFAQQHFFSEPSCQFLEQQITTEWMHAWSELGLSVFIDWIVF